MPLGEPLSATFKGSREPLTFSVSDGRRARLALAAWAWAWPTRAGRSQPGQCAALLLRPPAAAAALAEAVGSLPLRMPASFLLAGGAADAQHERPEPHQPVWLP